MYNIIKLCIYDNVFPCNWTTVRIINKNNLKKNMFQEFNLEKIMLQFL